MSKDLDQLTRGPCRRFWMDREGAGTPITVQPAFDFRGRTAHPYIPWREMFMGVMGTVAGAVLVNKARAPQLLETEQPLRKTKFFEGYQLLILPLIWLLILGFGGIPQQVGSSEATSTRRVVLS